MSIQFSRNNPQNPSRRCAYKKKILELTSPFNKQKKPTKCKAPKKWINSQVWTWKSIQKRWSPWDPETQINSNPSRSWSAWRIFSFQKISGRPPTPPQLENCTKPETRVSYRAFKKGTLFDPTQKVSHTSHTIALFDPHQIGDLTVPVSKKVSHFFFWIPIFALQCMIEVDVNEFHSFSSAGNNRLPFISIIFPHVHFQKKHLRK